MIERIEIRFEWPITPKSWTTIIKYSRHEKCSILSHRISLKYSSQSKQHTSKFQTQFPNVLSNIIFVATSTPYSNDDIVYRQIEKTYDTEPKSP